MDWKTLIVEIRAAGLTQMQIAARSGCSQSAISQLEAGNILNPGWVVGQALTALHTELRPKKEA